MLVVLKRNTDSNATIVTNIFPDMYIYSYEICIFLYMHCDGRAKCISISSVIFMYRTIFETSNVLPVLPY